MLLGTEERGRMRVCSGNYMVSHRDGLRKIQVFVGKILRGFCDRELELVVVALDRTFYI
jgi:hypothetical protein